MRITSLRIRHYKSLGDVLLEDLSPITLLVGTNATGKSNVIDALRFLRDAAIHDLDHAVSSRGGIELIRQYSRFKPYHINFQIEFTHNENRPGGMLNGFYELTLASGRGGNYRVEKEEAEWTEINLFETDEGEEEESIDNHKFNRDANGKVIFDENPQERPIPIDELFINRGGYLIRQNLASLRFSAIYPNTLRSPARPDTDRRLKENGENWASILKSMRQSPAGRNAINSIIEMMQFVMPSLTGVRVKGVGGYLVPQFLVKDSQNSKEHAFDPLQLSDGTLRIFGMLMALYQRPSSSVLALEEPEQTVNPAILAMLSDAFKEVSERTQLFLTTHSPHLVDFFEPEQIRVVTMTNGQTEVLPIKSSQVAAVKEQLISLEELMSQGNLFAENGQG
jgi:predicted ATPase